jgi:hypothetical protein
MRAMKGENETAAATTSSKPEDWPAAAVRSAYFNADDLDRVMALYEPEARFVTWSGENPGRS